MGEADHSPGGSDDTPGAGVAAALRPAASSRAASLLLAAAAVALAAGPARGQEVGPGWDCFRSWTVSTAKESEPFRVDRSPWALSWKRATPPHSDHDGLFAELFRVTEAGEKSEDQVAAVNTDHEGHDGTVTVDDEGRFWVRMESWSEETEWTLEACVPTDSAGRSPRAARGR